MRYDLITDGMEYNQPAKWTLQQYCQQSCLQNSKFCAILSVVWQIKEWYSKFCAKLSVVWQIKEWNSKFCAILSVV